jgi:hypothetical protein
MKKNLLLVVVAMLFATTLTFGQQPQFRNLPIYRYFMSSGLDLLDTNVQDVSTITFDSTLINWGGWDTASNASTYNMWWVKHFTTGAYYELEATGYSGSADHVSDQWFVSPYFNTNNYASVSLNFSSECAKYAGASIVVMVSTNYKGGAPANATWDTLQGLTIPSPNGTSTSGWKHSGNGNLSAYAGDSVCIAFHYTSTALAAATYYVDSIQITGSELVGIKNINSAQKVSIYPNPVSNYLIINNMNGVNSIKISDILGETIQNLTVSGSNANINVSNLSKGIYFISLMNDKSILETKKFVKN